MCLRVFKSLAIVVIVAVFVLLMSFVGFLSIELFNVLPDIECYGVICQIYKSAKELMKTTLTISIVGITVAFILSIISIYIDCYDIKLKT